MKKIFLLLILIITFYSKPVNAAVAPSDSIITKSVKHNASLNKFLTSTPSEIEKITGKKLNFVERIQLKFFQKKLLKHSPEEGGEPTAKQKKQGKISMILGISSIVLLLIPYVGLLSIPAAIAAMVLGIKSIKGNSNTQGLIGLITGSATLFIILIAILIVASGGFWY